MSSAREQAEFDLREREVDAFERIADALEAGVDLLQTRNRQHDAAKAAFIHVAKEALTSGMIIPESLADKVAKALDELERVPS